MTWAGSQCLHCRKQISKRQGQADFCSPDCATAFRKQASAERHGISPSMALVPASVRTVARTLAVSQRIREQVEANAHRLRTPRPMAQLAEPQPPFAAPLALEGPALRSISHARATPGRALVSAIAPSYPSQDIFVLSAEPGRSTDLKPLGASQRRPSAILLRGSFPFFPIGDLALIAPVQLPGDL